MHHQVQVGFSLPLQPPGGAPGATVRFHGYATYSAPDPQAAEMQLRPTIAQATQSVIGTKLVQNQLALPTLSMSMPALAPEIVAATQSLGAQGITVHSLTLNADVPQEAVQPAAGQVMSGADIAKNVAGNFAENAMASAASSFRPNVKANVGGFNVSLGPGGASVGEQIGDEIGGRILHYVIIGGVVLLVSGICMIAMLVKIMF